MSYAKKGDSQDPNEGTILVKKRLWPFFKILANK